MLTRWRLGMNCRLLAVMVLVGLLFACATKAEKPNVPGVQQKDNRSAPAISVQNVDASVVKEIRDGQIANMSNFTATEEANWMNPKNPADLKRLYVMDGYSILLPEDVFPVKTDISGSSWLFKFSRADAYIYAFLPKGIAASSLLEINLNSLDLIQAKGYHDAMIDLKENVLRMSYRNDGIDDGYIRYVQIKKEYVGRKMSIFALMLKDQGLYQSLAQEYDSTLSTIKPINN
jgi:hypothetical protein